MKNVKHLCLFLCLALCSISQAHTVSESWTVESIRNKDIRAYIKQHKDYALMVQSIYGVPASITLAQAGIESNWGRNNFAKTSNNHFGHHCHRGWQGESAERIDNGKLACFRVYNSILDAYKGHGKFLTTQRTKYRDAIGKDWKVWAMILQRDGYAEAGHYFEMIYSIINYNRLFELDCVGV